MIRTLFKVTHKILNFFYLIRTKAFYLILFGIQNIDLVYTRITIVLLVSICKVKTLRKKKVVHHGRYYNIVL